jgi:hypothetical protein
MVAKRTNPRPAEEPVIRQGVTRTSADEQSPFARYFEIALRGTILNHSDTVLVRGGVAPRR